MLGPGLPVLASLEIPTSRFARDPWVVDIMFKRRFNTVETGIRQELRKKSLVVDSRR